MSGECAAGRHRSCPGYWKMAHPCPCSCHQTCRHPASAARWDEHRAILRCATCGRDLDPPLSDPPTPPDPLSEPSGGSEKFTALGPVHPADAS